MEGWDLYQMLSPIVVIIIGMVSMFLTKLIHQKTQNAILAGILGRLNETVWDEVRAAEQVTVKGIKAAKEPSSDGGPAVTKTEGLQIKRAVMERIKQNMGMSGLEKLGKILGLDSSGVTYLIESKIEAALFAAGSTENP